MAVDYDLRNERLERLAQIIDAESLTKELQEQADANYSSGGRRSVKTGVSVKVRGDDRKFVRSFTREALAEALMSVLGSRLPGLVWIWHMDIKRPGIFGLWFLIDYTSGW